MSKVYGLIRLKQIMGTKNWLIYIACLSLLAAWCVAVGVVALIIF